MVLYIAYGTQIIIYGIMEPFPVPGVSKTVIHAGKGDIPNFEINTKVLYRAHTHTRGILS